jgi:hypothetical protein
MLLKHEIKDYNTFITYCKATYSLYGYYKWVPNYSKIQSYCKHTYCNETKLIDYVYLNIEERRLNRD